MSREVSRSRTRSPVDHDVQRILNLDSSPGSSRKHGEEGEDEGVHIPNFSKEVSLDEEDNTSQTMNINAIKQPESQTSAYLIAPVEIPKLNVSPKGILKRRVPEREYSIGVTETREKTKCCHPLVNKIKHLADKTLHKFERNENEKSPLSKRKKNEGSQEIRQLRSSPGAVRRQKFSAIKLGDSDEMSKTMSLETPPPRKKKEHIYEDIEEAKDLEKSSNFATDIAKHSNDVEIDSKSDSNKENESLLEKKSVASQDPSLVAEDTLLKFGERIMEKLHKMDNVDKEAILLDEEMDPEEPNVDEVFQGQLDETRTNNDSPNITITEITDEDVIMNSELLQPTATPIESSPTPSPHDIDNRKDFQFVKRKWSKPSSDHEYEIIEKPPPNIVYTAPSIEEKPNLIKTDDELSSTTSLERKCLQHTSDEEEPVDDRDNLNIDKEEELVDAEALQKNIEDRFFVNTPSTTSRTECEVSTSQVDSSALEQLPLKRDSRKNAENMDSKIQQRIREGTGKIKSQAGKLKTKLQNIKTNKFTMRDRPKFSLPERPKFKMPERPKISLPERPKFTLPDRRKFSLPERPKFNFNMPHLKSLDRKKFSFPERPKFSVPELPKFKMPSKPNINFPSLGRKKEYKVEPVTTGSISELGNVASEEFEVKTYPRLFGKKKKTKLQKTSSSPTLNREDTPPATFTFTRVGKAKEDKSLYIPDSPEQPREYGTIDDDDTQFQNDMNVGQKYDTTYDFDKLDTEFIDPEMETSNLQSGNETSINDISPSKQEYTPVITEINNDEFFVRPRGISREDIQVREYLSDETRQAFKTPKNILAMMDDSIVNDDNLYINDEEVDPELMVEDNEAMRYSNEDLNERDDGYYTFPPVRPSRAKRKKKEIESDVEPTPYIDESANPSVQLSEVDLRISEDKINEHHFSNGDDGKENCENDVDYRFDFAPTKDLQSIHEYANDDVIQYPENVPIESQTLPMPPKRRKKIGKRDLTHSSLNDFQNVPSAKLWEEPQEEEPKNDLIVYCTEHEYVVPQEDSIVTGHSPLPPRRNRSRSSRGTSLCDDDRTSHGAESLTLDTNMPHTDVMDVDRDSRHESPGYATVDKGSYIPSKGIRRSISKTPPVRRRKSNSSERKYYTVGSNKTGPNRPPRKKSSTSLVTLDNFSKRSASSDLTQYVEIDEPFETHKNLKSGDIINRMKDRPLPPPPRPPRGSRRRRKNKNDIEDEVQSDIVHNEHIFYNQNHPNSNEDVVEVEVSTQTDLLPDDVDFELGLDEHFDISMSSSLKDMIDEESILSKSHTKIEDSSRISRPSSRSEKSFRISDPKISELSKPNIGRTSPTVILVEKRVSSPTRINERDEMLTEASLTVQHIDVDESQIPDVPPLPRSKAAASVLESSKNKTMLTDNRAIESLIDANRDMQLDNVVTQRLQVKDLDVGRLNVTELQANKILVSDIEGMTMQVAELDSKSGHISVSGIEFSQSVIDEIVKKFAEISTSYAPPRHAEIIDIPRPVSREEETQTEGPANLDEPKMNEKITEIHETHVAEPPSPPPRPGSNDESSLPPQRPPPPDLTPLLYSYLQDITIPPASFYPPRTFRERVFPEHHDSQVPTPPPPTRRVKRKPAAPHSASSSDDDRIRPSPRRMPAPVRTHEPSITEAGVQFLRVCHSTISRTIRSMFNSFMAYISGTEDKRDIQMALVIFLVLIAGLIMFGLSDSRTIHHHHWEFFNPPDGKQ